MDLAKATTGVTVSLTVYDRAKPAGAALAEDPGFVMLKTVLGEKQLLSKALASAKEHGDIPKPFEAIAADLELKVETLSAAVKASRIQPLVTKLDEFEPIASGGASADSAWHSA